MGPTVRIGSAVLTLALAARAGAQPAATTAPVATIPNPQYAGWANRKPGASATLVCDMGVGPDGGPVRLAVTQTLRGITPDAATVASATVVTAAGQAKSGGPPTVQVIPARIAPAEMHQAGVADVPAMGRTFACKVYQVTKTMPGGGASKAAAYLNDAVPGGIVKLVVAAPQGGALTFVLAAVDDK